MFLERLSDDYVAAHDAYSAGQFAQLVQGSSYLGRYADKWDEVVFPPHQFDIHPPIKHSFLGALVGAVLLLWIFKLVTSRTRTL
jgi:hypothetical protein